MVGIVLVSHSPALALGLSDLLAQIGSSEVPVAVAGGTASGDLGTSSEAVERALEAVASPDGVVIIPDLGSAVLTVKAVLAERDDNGFVLVDAPFVEGAVAAAVTAASGGSLDVVVQAAKEARDVPKF
ncbi:MAG: hypothetical protein QOH26_1553 [Actinomycetota bacterium]|jgi:dihydroxyacetone kinase phosphotransfer subunit|nr:hypothetical protein [Actinomycetota bacterium]